MEIILYMAIVLAAVVMIVCGEYREWKGGDK